MDGFGLGIGMSGTPTQAMRLSEMDAQMNERSKALEAARQQKAAEKSQAAMNKITEQDFKIDPTKFHKFVIPDVTKDAQLTLNQIMHERETNPYNWENSVQNILLDWRGRAAQYQQQSKQFFDAQELASKGGYHVPTDFLNIINGTPGDKQALADYISKTRGFQGVNISNDGFVTYSPIKNVDTEAEWNKFQDQRAAWTEKIGKPTSSGIPGVMQVPTIHDPNMPLVEGFMQEKVNDPDYLAALMAKQDPSTIPANVNLNDKKSVSDYALTLLQQDSAKKMAPYTTTSLHNIPEKTTKADPTNQTGRWIKMNDGTWGYSTGKAIWQITKDSNTGKYVTVVRSMNEKESPDLELPYFAGNTAKAIKGKVSGFNYDPSTNQFRLNMIERSKTGDIDSPTYETNPVDIGYHRPAIKIIQGEYGGDPWTITRMLSEKNFGMKLPALGNVQNQKPATSGKATAGTKTDDLEYAKQFAKDTIPQK